MTFYSSKAKNVSLEMLSGNLEDVYFTVGLGEILEKMKFEPGILAQMYLEVKFNFKNISQNNFFSKNGLQIWPRIQRSTATGRLNCSTMG